MATIKTKSDVGLKKGLPVSEVKSVSDAGEFEGYASVFGALDRGGDVVLSGAFHGSLARRPAERVKMLWQHDPGEPIGRWLEMREDARGLYVKGQIITTTQRGRDTYELLKAGVIDGLSIGYRTVEDEYDRDAGVRRLKEVELVEVSVVTFPMLESAQVGLVKGDTLPTEREFETWLKRDAGFTASQAKAIIADGYRAFTKSERDAGCDGDGGVAQALQQLAAAFRR